MLEKLAEAQGYGTISQLLEAWIRVHPAAINEAFNGEIRHRETGPETDFFQERKCGNVGFPLVRPPGFEPGSPAWQADVLARLDYGR